MAELFSEKNSRRLLIFILVLSAVLRFLGFNSAEIFHDEGAYAFRSIGYLDYLNNDDQSTPIQWFKNAELPFWTYLSFHDHPPLFFIIQHSSFLFFGDSLFAARLPSVLAGIATVFLTYLIFFKIFRSKSAGLLAAGILCVNHTHIWISRSSLIESILTFFIFLNFYCFLKALGDRKWWKFFGITLGLCFLTKYTAVFLVPAYLIYLALFRREIFKNKAFYFSLLIVFILFLPIIIYNIYLFKSVSHFDLQFTYLFKQSAPEWKAAIGKIQEPFSNIIFNLLSVYSMAFVVIVLAGLAVSFYLFFLKFKGKNNMEEQRKFLVFGWLIFLFVTFILVAAGSAFRFLALYLLPFLFFAAVFINFLFDKFNRNIFIKIFLAVFLTYELYFSVGGIFFEFPDFGIVKLDKYLDGQFNGLRSKNPPASPNPHLEKIIKYNLIEIKPADKSFMIVYDENLSLAERLWLYTRRIYYRGIPAVTTGHFKTLLKSMGINSFSGYEIYFVKATENTVLNPYYKNSDASELEIFLKEQFNLSPEKTIYGKNNAPMFLVYKIVL